MCQMFTDYTVQYDTKNCQNMTFNILNIYKIL